MKTYAHITLSRAENGKFSLFKIKSKLRKVN